MRIRHALPAVVLAAFVAATRPAVAQPRTQTVRGVVQDTGGAPIEGAEVVVGTRRTRTGGEGTFRIDSLAPGRYPLTIRMIGFAPVLSRVAVVATEPTELEYVLTPAPALLRATVVEARRAGIFGVVGDTAYRQLVGARVQLLGPRTFDVRSDSVGRFAFPDLPAGEYVVRVTQRGYAERRIAVALPKGEGRDLSLLLPPARQAVSMMDNVAALDLGRRLAMGLRRERIAGAELERLTSGGGCNVAAIRGRLGTARSTTIIMNGRFVLGGMTVDDICTFGLENLDLIELGADACAEVTHTIAALLQLSCAGRLNRERRSYVVLWERR